MDANGTVTDALRVLFVMGANGTGGTELQARALIAALRDRGLVVQVVLLDGHHGVDGLPSDTQAMAPHRPGPVQALFMYGTAIRRIRKSLRAGDFDVIHGVNARGYGVAALAAFGVADVRKVAWRRNLGIHLSGRKAVVTRLLERSALRASDVVLANSSDVRDYWVSRHGLLNLPKHWWSTTCCRTGASTLNERQSPVHSGSWPSGASELSKAMTCCYASSEWAAAFRHRGCHLGGRRMPTHACGVGRGPRCASRPAGSSGRPTPLAGQRDAVRPPLAE